MVVSKVKAASGFSDVTATTTIGRAEHVRADSVKSIHSSSVAKGFWFSN